MPTPYTLDLTATQVNNAVNAAHDTVDPVTAASTKLVRSGEIYNAIVNKMKSVLGWAKYVDSTYTSVNALTSGNSGAKTQITIDGQGAGSTETYLPTGVSEFWNTTDNKIVAGSEGDAYDLRLDFMALPTQHASDYAEIILEIASPTPEPIARRTITFTKAWSTAFSIGVPIYASSALITHGCKLYLETPAGVTITIFDISLFIKRDFSPIS